MLIRLGSAAQKMVLPPTFSNARQAAVLPAAAQRRTFALKFNQKKPDDDKDKENKQKALPDPRTYFGKLYDMFWMPAYQRVFFKVRDNALYRFRYFFGLKQEEKTWYSRLMGGGNNQDSYFNIFGQQAANEHWNPLQRSKSAAKWFIAKVIVFILCLKLSWNFLKSLILYPFYGGGGSTTNYVQPVVVKESPQPVAAPPRIDAKTQLELKQVELELAKLKLEIEKEKTKNASKGK